jgi:NAD(P)-dependent dehydrogenase (short-subunit alcohol dehydrogenase family)
MAQGRIADRVAIVTGAGSGIGKATAELFAQEGAKVIVADLANSPGEAVAKEIGGIFVATDVREPKQVENLVRVAIEKFGGLDIMYNNAGICLNASLLEHSDEYYLNTIRTDLDSVFWGLRYAGKVMVAQKRGAIINTASVAGIRASVGLSAYNAAKFGVVGLTQNAALEFASAGVRVNCVCPGVIDTPLVARTSGNSEAVRELLHRAHPLGRMGKPAEVAKCVLFLASDDASFVTGHALIVDGGVSAGFGTAPASANN